MPSQSQNRFLYGNRISCFLPHLITSLRLASVAKCLIATMRPFNTLVELIVINRPSSSKLELGLLLLVFDLDLSFFGVCLRCAEERFRFALRSSLSVLFNDAALPLLIRLGGRSLLRRARSRRPVCSHQIIVKIPAKSLHAPDAQKHRQITTKRLPRRSLAVSFGSPFTRFRGDVVPSAFPVVSFGSCLHGRVCEDFASVRDWGLRC